MRFLKLLGWFQVLLAEVYYLKQTQRMNTIIFLYAHTIFKKHI